VIFAIDPGTTQSAYVVWNPEKKEVVKHGIVPNMEMFSVIKYWKPEIDKVVIEMIASYGMPVGREVFETCVWIGRYMCYSQMHRLIVDRIFRAQCKMEICHNTRAKDANVRQALIDLFPATGGGKVPQIGLKKTPGPLFGVSKDVWAALAVAIAYCKKNNIGPLPF